MVSKGGEWRLASMALMASMAPVAMMVLIVSLTSMTSMEAPLLLRSCDAAIIGVIKTVGVLELATSRETARSRSLRCVDKIKN